MSVLTALRSPRGKQPGRSFPKCACYPFGENGHFVFISQRKQPSSAAYLLSRILQCSIHSRTAVETCGLAEGWSLLFLGADRYLRPSEALAWVWASQLSRLGQSKSGLPLITKCYVVFCFFHCCSKLEHDLLLGFTFMGSRICVMKAAVVHSSPDQHSQRGANKERKWKSRAASLSPEFKASKDPDCFIFAEASSAGPLPVPYD